MRLDAAAMRARVAGARSAHLATVAAEGQPHLVPITFVVDADHLWTAVDHKPKSTRDLRRLRNIAANPKVSVLVDHYDDDWSRLWWVRLDGVARVLTGDARPGHAVELLRGRYPQYRETPPAGPLIEVAIHTWRGWAAGAHS